MKFHNPSFPEYVRETTDKDEQARYKAAGWLSESELTKTDKAEANAPAKTEK